MSLFQASVLKKYLQDLDKKQTEEAYERYVVNFGDTNKQNNIRLAKEEQYQEGFLRELFCAVLGYTINPENNYNLTTEYKNEKDAKKADGAILKDNKPIAIIELKGTDTVDLDTVEQQAFNYKNNQSACKYVVISNFEKLRFYIENAIEFEEFDLFNLTQDKFELLYLCLAKECLLNDIPLAIKQASVAQEENITKQLYNDYSALKRAMFNNIVELNPSYDKLLLYKKTQKLLDRFLFIFFAEDRLLLPPNSIREILKQWETLKELDSYTPLYERFKKYFGYLLTGHKGKQYEIFAYNGGLFEADDVLDNIAIDDTLLFTHLTRLADYNYETEVDVNILGHIFEHSLNEIEQIQAELEGQETDKSKTKRKKDGIFYTPKYITKYIVENTVGALCYEKKQELQIVEDDFSFAKRKEKRKELIEKLDTYRNWLLKLTICDPACGSGAFLVQALNFLIDEHKLIDELQARVLDSSIVFPNIQNTILENNLYGVDLNDESVEIAKLSLWLRTAQKGRKLTSLNNNIKCGNSLIDDPAIAGDKAFNWQKEFPEVFSNGGFDVVIGNPPYVDIKGLDPKIVNAFFKYFTTAENRINLYSLFIEKGYSIIKEQGYFSFINPNSILVNSSYTKIRRLLINDITTIIKLPDDVFPDAKVETIIFEFRKGCKQEQVATLVYSKDEKINFIDKNNLKFQNKEFWKQSDSMNYNIYVSGMDISILKKCQQNTVSLEKFADFTLGITPYDKYKGHSDETINKRLFHSTIKIDESYKPLISGSNVIRYFVSPQIVEYIKYGDWLGAMREERFFTDPRIIVRQIVSGHPPRIYAGFTDQPYYFTQIGFGIISKSELDIKYLLAMINSSLLSYYHKYNFLDLEKELFQKILIANCKQFPIKNISLNEQEPFIKATETMIVRNKELQELKTKITKLLSSKYTELNITNKLADWTELDFKTFVKELDKQKIKLSLPEQAEWLDYFEKEKAKAQEIKAIIDKTDKEIDSMVYQLYGLTDEEIRIVEGV